MKHTVLESLAISRSRCVGDVVGVQDVGIVQRTTEGYIFISSLMPKGIVADGLLSYYTFDNCTAQSGNIFLQDY